MRFLYSLVDNFLKCQLKGILLAERLNKVAVETKVQGSDTTGMPKELKLVNKKLFSKKLFSTTFQCHIQ